MFLSKLSIQRPVFISMIAIALVVFGYMGYKNLGIDLFPNVDIPVVFITTVYPGADAATIENDVVKKIEDAVGTVNGIKHIHGSAYQNIGTVVIEFDVEVNINVAAQEVRDKVSIIQKDLPKDIEAPKVEKFDFQSFPIVTLVLKAPPGEKLSEVTQIAEKKVKNQIQMLYGVGNVEVIGGRKREIRIHLDPYKMNSLNIPPLTLIRLISGVSTDMPAGNLKMKGDSEEVVIKSDSEAKSVEKLRNIPIMNIGGSMLKIGDFSTVEDGMEEEESASYRDLSPTVALQVRKQPGINTVKMAEDVKASLPEIEKILPSGYKLEIASDSSPFIRRAVENSIDDILIGAFLAILTVFLFLRNIRATIISALALPTSVIGTFLAVKALGFTLNYMTTLALSISIGLLVDDAIVVIENIFRHKEMGKDRVTASLDATNEIGFAVIAITLTIVSVFGPTIYIHGVMGQFFKQFGITVSVAVLISLFVSFTVTPLVSSLILEDESKDFWLYRWIEKILTAVENGYASSVGWVLNHKAMTFIVFMLIFVMSLGLSSKLKKEFVGRHDEGTFTLKIELPGDTSIEKSKIVTREVVEKIKAEPWQEFVLSTVGGGAAKEKNIINVFVRMVPVQERTIDQAAAIDDIRKKFEYLVTKYEAKVSLGDAGNGAPLQVSVLGADYDRVSQNAQKLLSWMKKNENLVDIQTTEKGNKKELRIQYDHKKMAELGVSPAESGLALRQMVAGYKVANFKEKGEMYDIKVYIDPTYLTLENIKNISLNTNKGGSVRLSDVANITYDSSEILISRQERNRKVGITAGITKDASVGQEADKIRQFVKDNFTDGVQIRFLGEAERMQESFADLGQVLIIAIILIYMILASQFNSFIHPFTIMSALPFAMTGALGSLYLTNLPLSIFSFIGIIMLMGLVTKNSILLVDFAVKGMEERALDMRSALIEAGRIRLRPILMTTFAMIFGMMPIAVAVSEGSEIKRPMAVTVMGGLIFSTIVTLFIVPIIFSFFNRITNIFSKKGRTA